MNEFRYVVLNDNKSPIEKLSDGGHPLEDVMFEDNLAILVPEPFVVFDFDDEEDAKIIKKIIEDKDLKCIVMDTSRGCHVWFKSPEPWKNHTGIRTALGVNIDVRSHGKLSYVVVKLNGEWRNWVRTMEFKDIQEVPKWLTPVKKDIDFKDMAEGDGRNDALFSYIATLQNKGFTKSEVIETINLINNYMLVEPMSESEMEVILRDDAFIDDNKALLSHCFDLNGKIIHNVFGDELIKRYNIVTFNDLTYIYKDGYYQRDNRLVEQAMIEMVPNIKSHMRSEVLKYIAIKTHIPSNQRNDDTYILNIKNGRLDVRTGELLPHDPNIVEFVRVPVTYVPNHYDIHVDKMLNKLFVNDMEVRDLFEEMLGYCLVRNTRYQRGFMFYGDGSNGKSTMLEMIRNFLGRENVSSVDLTKLHENYATAELEHKLANIGDDIESGKLKETSVIKRLFTGDAINTRRIYGEPFDLYSYAKMIFSANQLPYSADKSHGFFRRIEFIPLEAKISPSDPDFDPYIQDKVTTESAKSYLLNMALKGLNRLVTNGDFTIPKTVKEAKERYKTVNSTTLTWIYEENISKEYLTSRHIKECYSDFLDYCKLAGVKNVSTRQSFTKEINSHFNFESANVRIDGVQGRAFRPVEE